MNADMFRNGSATVPIPKGFRHIKGEWDTGFVIRQCLDERFESASEFVWIPVCSLNADGTLDGVSYAEQFGARDYGYSGSPSRNIPAELLEQAESVKKYGGFYMSRFPVSMDDDGSPCSVAERMPYTMVTRVAAKKAACTYNGGPDVTAHLPYAAEQDSMLAWLAQTGKITMEEIRRFTSIRDSRYPQRKPVYYAGIQEDERNGLMDVLSNVDEWTQEQFDEAYLNGCGLGCTYPKTARCYNRPYACYKYWGFRIALTLK